MDAKPIDELTLTELLTYHVWQFDPDDTAVDETCITPVVELPVDHLSGRFIVDQVKLANGENKHALIGNFDTKDSVGNTQLVDVTLFNGPDRFHLARYFDVDYDTAGPEALARFLKLSIEEIFPITYDLHRYVSGASASLEGTIEAEPYERLSDEEIMQLIINRL